MTASNNSPLGNHPDLGIAERYHVQERIGSGGMARVFRATDTVLEREVAIKVLHDHLADDATLRARFEREAKFLASFNHPNVIPIYDYAVKVHQDRYLCYMVMTYLPGPTLADVLQGYREREAILPLTRSLSIIADLAAALAYAHQQNMIHRDVKPANILFDSRGQAVLTDFGIARLAEGSQLTQENMAVGTPAYMAPEQASGETVSNQTDIYALGVVAYEMLAGEPPYAGGSGASVLIKHIQDPIPSITKLPHIENISVDSVFEKALAKKPTDRYTSVTQFADELTAAMQSPKPVAVRPPALAPRQQHNSPARLLMMGLTIMAFIGGGALITRLTSNEIVIATPEEPLAPLSTQTSDPNDFRNFGGVDSMVDEQGLDIMALQNTAFSSNFADDDPLLGGEYWEMGSEIDADRDGIITREVQDGTLLFTNSIPGRAATTIAQGYTYDVPITITADLSLHGDSPANSGYGLVFNYQDSSNFGVFAVDGTGSYSIWYLIDRQWAELRNADENWTANSAVNRVGTLNTLQLEVAGGQLIGYINGEEVTRVNNDSLTTGGVGLYLATPRDQASSVTIIDNFAVSLADSGTVSSMTSDSYSEAN